MGLDIPERAALAALDASDPLAPLRACFEMPDGLIYLDGNSLGPLPRHLPDRLSETVRTHWGRDLVRSWNDAGWAHLPARVGARISALIGAHADEVIVADSTSVNLFKLLSAALTLQAPRPVILSDAGNFPSDLYIAQGLCAQSVSGHTLRLVPRETVTEAIDDSVAVVMLTQVDYRTGARYDLRAVTDCAHRAGALVIWDLAHSAGAFPVDLNAAGADFAVGCGYKYLNGGPGAPGFAFVARALQSRVRQPLTGWWGHADPFAFSNAYQPAHGVARLACGTPPVLSMVALDAALDVFDTLAAHGGLAAAQAKSIRMAELFIEGLAPCLIESGLRLVSPRDPALRGSHVSFAAPSPDTGYALMQALIARGVIGDFRAPDLLRFGFAAPYLRYHDIGEAVAVIRDVLTHGSWRSQPPRRRPAVT